MRKLKPNTEHLDVRSPRDIVLSVPVYHENRWKFYVFDAYDGSTPSIQLYWKTSGQLATLPAMNDKHHSNTRAGKIYEYTLRILGLPIIYFQVLCECDSLCLTLSRICWILYLYVPTQLPSQKLEEQNDHDLRNSWCKTFLRTSLGKSRSSGEQEFDFLETALLF